MSVELTGFDELDRKLLALGDSAQIKRVARNAIRAGQRVLVAGIKSKIPGRYKDARKAIGSSLKRTKFGENAGQVAAKVGAGVGKPRVGNKPVDAFDAMMRGKARRRRGVGLSSRNIHWAILGTDQRQHKSAHGTGRMPAILAGVVKSGVTAASGSATEKIKQTMAAQIAKLAK